MVGPFEKDYKWSSQVYQLVQPSSGHGKLIWHSLGPGRLSLFIRTCLWMQCAMISTPWC